MKLTGEQSQIVEFSKKAVGTKITIGINAYAGTGKTTTLMSIIKECPEKRFLYIAFNASAAADFQSKCSQSDITNVTIKTVHALAYQHARPAKVRAEYRTAELSEILGVKFNDAEACRKVFGSFCTSQINDIHKVPGEARHKILAEKLYIMMEHGEIDQTHSFYLKHFSLMLLVGAAKVNGFDCVLLDEAQDTNPVALSIFNSIETTRIFVGDTHQSIYGFNGAINAMRLLKADHFFSLRANFRSSPEIIEAANAALGVFKNDPIGIIPAAKPSGGISEKAVISRNNSTLISHIKKIDSEFFMIRPPEVVFAAALAIYHWDREEDDLIPKEYAFLKRFPSRDKILSYIQESGDRELDTAIRLVEEEAKSGGSIYDIYEKAKKNNNKNAKIILTTAHSAKGLEFDEVELASDFPNLLDILDAVADGEKSLREFDEETNLYYVAITRAKFILEDNTRNKTLISEAERGWVKQRVDRMRKAIIKTNKEHK